MEQLLVPYQASPGLPARSVLVLAPHADDEVFGCGGALALHVRAGVPVRVVVLTDGAAGGMGDALETSRLRAEESLAAARVIGYAAPEFWHLPDRGLGYGEALVERIAEAIRNSRADLVYAPSVREMHPDHLITALASLEAVRRVGGELRLAMYEIGVPLPPTTLVDITGVRAIKAEAGRAFASQLARQDYDQQIAALNRFRSYTLPRQVEAAEAYWVVAATELQRGSGIAALLEPEAARRRKLGLPFVDAGDLPLVSVLVRSMDRPALEATLDSVAIQTYANIEIVVVAASAEHRALPQNWGGMPLRLVKGAGPLHRSEAANLALDRARGEYVAFLDDDDFIDPGHVAGLVAHLRAHPGCRAAYSAVRTIDPAGNPLEPVFDTSYDQIVLLFGNFIPIHAVVFERSLVAADGCRFDPAFNVYEDWDFWLQVSRHTAFDYLDACTAVYRIADGGGSGVNSDEEVRAAGRRLVFDKWLPVFATDSGLPIAHALSEAVRLKAETRRLAGVISERDTLLISLRQDVALADQALAQRDAIIAALQQAQAQALAQRDATIAALQQAQAQALAHRDAIIREREATLRDRDAAVRDQYAALRDQEAAIAMLKSSTSWRLTAPLRAASRLLNRLAGRPG